MIFLIRLWSERTYRLSLRNGEFRFSYLCIYWNNGDKNLSLEHSKCLVLSFCCINENFFAGRGRGRPKRKDKEEEDKDSNEEDNEDNDAGEDEDD